MANLFDLDAELAGIQQGAAVNPETDESSIFTGVGDFLSDLGGAGLGALDNLFSLLDRFNSAKNNAIGVLGGAPSASVSQIFEQFDPFNLITPDVEAEVFTGEELFKELGVGDTEIAGGVGTRDVGGFAFDLLTDPLNLVGGFIAKGVTKTLKFGGKNTLAFLEGLAGVEDGAGLLKKSIPRSADEIAKLQLDEFARVGRQEGVNPSVMLSQAGEVIEGVDLVPRKNLDELFGELAGEVDDEVAARVANEGIFEPIEIAVDRATGRMEIVGGEDMLRLAKQENFKNVPVRIVEGNVPAPIQSKGNFNRFTDSPGEQHIGQGKDLQFTDSSTFDGGGKAVVSARTGASMALERDEFFLPAGAFSDEAKHLNSGGDIINRTGDRTKIRGEVSMSIEGSRQHAEDLVFQVRKDSVDALKILDNAGLATTEKIDILAALNAASKTKKFKSVEEFLAAKGGFDDADDVKKFMGELSEKQRIADESEIEAFIRDNNETAAEFRARTEAGEDVDQVLDDLGVFRADPDQLPEEVFDIPAARALDPAFQTSVLGRGLGVPEVPTVLAAVNKRAGKEISVFDLAEDLGFQGVRIRPRGDITLLGNTAVEVVQHGKSATKGFKGRGVPAKKTPKRASTKLHAGNVGVGRSNKSLEKLLKLPEKVDDVDVIEEATRALKLGEKASKLPLGVGTVSAAAARGLISGGTLMSKHFALRNLPGAEKFQQIIMGAKGRERAALRKLENTSRQMARLLKDEINNKAVIDFIEESPASLELFAAEVMGQNPKKLNVGAGEEVLADFIADPKNTGTIKNLKAQIANMKPQAREALELYFEGSNDFFKLMPGKKGREIELMNRSLLHRPLVQDFIERMGLRQFTHVRTSGSGGTAEELARDMLADFADFVDTRGAKTIDVFNNPTSYLEKGLRNAKNYTKARKIAGSLKELEKEFPGMFETSLAKINFIEGKRYASAVAATDILSKVAENPEWVRSGVMTDSLRRGGWVQVPVEKLPPGLREQFAEEVIESKSLVSFESRTTKTLENIKERPPGLDDDIDFIQTVKKEVGKKKTKFKTVTSKETVPLLMRQEIAEALFSNRGVMNQMLKPNAVSDFKKMWRGVTRVWKGWTLGPFPSWWSRNFVGNLWLNHLAGVSNPALYAEAIPIQQMIGKALAGDIAGMAGKTIKIGDEVVPMERFLREIVDEGVVGGGFYTSDFGAEFIGAYTSGNPIRNLFKLDPQQNTAAKMGFTINSAIEDNARIAHYIAKRREGLAAAESAFSVKTHLFDYDNLTTFEQETLRDFVPFYSWFRQNIPAQFRAVAESPHKVAQIGKLKLTFDEKNRANIPDEIFPEWMQSSTPLVTGNINGKAHVFMLKNWLPLADLAEIDTPQKLMNFAMNASHPIIRETLAQTFNWEPYFQRAIERYPGERETLFGYPIGKRYSHILRNARMLNELDRNILPSLGFKTGSKWTQELLAELTPMENVARVGLGLKLQKIDLQKNKQFLMRKTRGEIREAQGRLRIARRSNDAANANILRLQISELREKQFVLASFDPTRHPALQGAAEGR